jgi:hypothetical protein
MKTAPPEEPKFKKRVKVPEYESDYEDFRDILGNNIVIVRSISQTADRFGRAEVILNVIGSPGVRKTIKASVDDEGLVILKGLIMESRSSG